MKVAGVVLAAGAGRRFGGPKLLAEVRGVPLVARVVDAALAAGLHQVVVVLGHHGAAVRRALGERPVRTATNPEPDRGLASSIALGIGALSPGPDGALFLPADQPWLEAALLRDLVDAFREEDGRRIVVPVHRGRRGAPVLFPADLFDELLGLQGDRGGRTLLGRHADRVREVEVAHPRALDDVDRPCDLEVPDGPTDPGSS